MYIDALEVHVNIAYYVWGDTASHVICCLLTSDLYHGGHIQMCQVL